MMDESTAVTIATTKRSAKKPTELSSLAVAVGFHSEWEWDGKSQGYLFLGHYM